MPNETPSDSDFARLLKLKPNECERGLGYTPAKLVEHVEDKGDAWVVVTARGSKHAIAKSEV